MPIHLWTYFYVSTSKNRCAWNVRIGYRLVIVYWPCFKFFLDFWIVLNGQKDIITITLIISYDHIIASTHLIDEQVDVSNSIAVTT